MLNALTDELRPILVKWEDMNRRYAETVQGDVAYWCGERTCVALLAAAAWATGGMGITEYDEQENADAEPCRRRVDVWLRINVRPSGPATTFVIEAKYEFVMGNTSPRLLERRLDRAATKVKLAQAQPGERRLALLFAVPKLTRGESMEKVRSIVHEVPNKELLSELTLESQGPESDDGYRFPGVFILARLVPA